MSRAGIRLLFCVCQMLNFQTGFLGKSFITFGADEWLFTCVCPFVHSGMLLQVAGRQIDTGGDLTVGLRGRRLLSSVSCGMFLQIAPVVECGVTFFAGVSLYSCVGPLV